MAHKRYILFFVDHRFLRAYNKFFKLQSKATNSVKLLLLIFSLYSQYPQLTYTLYIIGTWRTLHWSNYCLALTKPSFALTKPSFAPTILSFAPTKRLTPRVNRCKHRRCDCERTIILTIYQIQQNRICIFANYTLRLFPNFRNAKKITHETEEKTKKSFCTIYFHLSLWRQIICRISKIEQLWEKVLFLHRS